MNPVRLLRPAAALLALLLAGAPIHALAQDAPMPAIRPSPPLIKYGKWAVLGASLGLNYLAARSHHRADEAFDALEAYCFGDRTRCSTDPGGAYLDPLAEQWYQQSLREDRKARRYLIAGETALLGAAALFVWELTRPKRPPENIPFEPEIQVLPRSTRLGLRVAW